MALELDLRERRPLGHAQPLATSDRKSRKIFWKSAHTPSIVLSSALPWRPAQHSDLSEAGTTPSLPAGTLGSCVCFQKLLPDGFFIDNGEQFGIRHNPGLLTWLIFHQVY